MLYAFGFHPALAWPLPLGAPASEHRIIVDRPGSAGIWEVGNEPGLIGEGVFATPVNGSMLRPTMKIFRNDALIWDRLASRGLT